jgi:hypothetical protein
MLAFAAPALAGGWAVVTLDSLPSDVQAGQRTSLGFMVRQHGVHPTNDFYGEPLKPFLSAINQTTGESLEVDARKDGPVGHFVLDVTFPSAGAWSLEITPAPFPAGGTQQGTLTVLPAIAPQEQVSNVWLLQPATLRWSGIALLFVSASLILFGQRSRIGRRSVLRAR